MNFYFFVKNLSGKRVAGYQALTYPYKGDTGLNVILAKNVKTDVVDEVHLSVISGSTIYTENTYNSFIQLLDKIGK